MIELTFWAAHPGWPESIVGGQRCIPARGVRGAAETNTVESAFFLRRHQQLPRGVSLRMYKTHASDERSGTVVYVDATSRNTFRIGVPFQKRFQLSLEVNVRLRIWSMYSVPRR
jgi:hypothetical protein